MHAKNSLFIDTFQDAVKKAETHFGLTPPFTLDTLKAAYKRKCKELHPDAGGTNAAFQEMHEAYHSLARLQEDIGGIFSESGENGGASGTGKNGFPYFTSDGTPLTELGLGLGPLKNGAECAECEGKGYNPKKYARYTHVDCEHCNALGGIPREFPCTACHATGKFTQRHTGRVVDCRRCKGTGAFKHPYLLNRCPFCLGTRRHIQVTYEDEYYARCWKCKGTGETEVWNPALPKGRVADTAKAQRRK